LDWFLVSGGETTTFHLSLYNSYPFVVMATLKNLPPNTAKTVHSAWLLILLIIISGINFGLLALYFLLTEQDHITILYSFYTIFPLVGATLCFAVAFRPSEKHDHLRTAFLLVSLSCAFSRGYLSNNNLNMRLTLTAVNTGTIALFFRTGVKLSNRLQEKLKGDTNFYLTTMPRMLLSTVITMIYVSSEGFSCLMDNHGQRSRRCGDIIFSNEVAQATKEEIQQATSLPLCL